jgi:uncharacterized phage protein (TIGR02220 family)
MKESEIIKKVIDNLNSVCGTKYKPATKATVRHITARIKEGFELEEFYHVISFKNDQWGSDAKMMEFLRPETLFGTKFESYLNAALRVDKPKASGPVCHGIPENT